MQTSPILVILAVIATLLTAGLVLACVAMRRTRKKMKDGGATGGDVRAILEHCDAQTGTAIRLLVSAMGRDAAPTKDAPQEAAPPGSADAAYLEYLAGENARLQDELGGMKAALEDAGARAAAGEDALATANDGKAAAERERDEALEALREALGKAGRLEVELARKKEEVEDGKADMEDLRQKNDALAEEVNAGKKKVSEMAAEAENARSQTSVLSRELDDLDAEMKKAGEEHARAIAEKDAEIAERDAEIRSLNATLQKVADESRGEAEFKVLEEAILAKNRRILALTAELERLRRDTVFDTDGTMAAMDIAVVLDGNEEAVRALRRVGINDTHDIQAWSRDDLLCIPMINEHVLGRLDAFGVTLAEGSDEGHLAAIRIPRDKMAVPDNDDVRNNEILNTPIPEWRPKSSIDGLLLTRLSEYGIGTIAELTMIDKYYLQTLPGINNGQREALLRALRSEGNLDLGMTASDLALWAGRWRVEHPRKARRSGRRTGTLPFNSGDAAVLNKDIMRCGILSFGPLRNGRKVFVDNTGIKTLGDLAALRREDLALLWFFYGPGKMEKVVKALEDNGLHLGMDEGRRNAILESKEAYVRSTDALQLPLAVVLPTRKSVCERLAEKGCHVLGDLKDITFEEAFLSGVDKDTIAYLRDNCRARGINGVIMHSQEK